MLKMYVPLHVEIVTLLPVWENWDFMLLRRISVFVVTKEYQDK